MKIDQELQRLVRYNEWANNRMLDAFARLDDSTLATPMGQQVSSLLGHILSAQEYWGRIINPDLEKPADGEPDSVEALQAAFAASHQRLRKMITDDLNFEAQPLDGMSVTLATIVMQWHGHGVQHRGEAGLLLNLLGQDPGEVDYLMFAASDT